MLSSSMSFVSKISSYNRLSIVQNRSAVSGNSSRGYKSITNLTRPAVRTSSNTGPLRINSQVQNTFKTYMNPLHYNLGLRFYSATTGSEELATVHWILKNGEKKSITEKVGMNLLEIAHKHGIDLEGACEASLACSTCHIIVDDPDTYELTGEISDEENDMLDLAFGLTQTSRLGCQVKLTKELDGMVVRLPSATRNMMVDGHVPKPH